MQKLATRKRPVIASQAVVSANHPLASTAGLQMLAAGGTVGDAAVAAAFAASVVEPMMLGIFGAGYILIRDGQSGEFRMIDAYSPAPSKAAPEMYDETDRTAASMGVAAPKNRIGYLACAIPGSLKGWGLLHKSLGRLPLPFVLGPAIAYAEHGFPVSQHLFQCIEAEKEKLALFRDSAKIFLPGGKAPEVGHRLRNPDHAAVLRLIAQEGFEVFYRGALGERVVSEIQSNGGIVTRDDLENYSLIECEPIHGTYRGHEIVGVPLTSAGGILIQEALNILEGFNLNALGFATASYWHLILEVLKVIFADRNSYLGDPSFIDVPINRLLDKGYAAERRRSINLHASSTPASAPHIADASHTTHIAVMNAQGDMVLMTQTLMEFFGCRAVIPGTGAFMNNTMALFDPRPGRPNSIAPGKRMLTSTSSTIVMRDGAPRFALGTPGGERIFSAVLQAILNVIDHGMTLQEAVEAPRVFANGRVTEIESDVSPNVLEALKSMGHEVVPVFNVAGGMNGIEVMESGELRGAACWRADGAPAGLSGGPARVGNYAP